MEIVLADKISIAQSGTHGEFDLADDGDESEASGKRASRTGTVSVKNQIFYFLISYIYTLPIWRLDSDDRDPVQWQLQVAGR